MSTDSNPSAPDLDSRGLLTLQLPPLSDEAALGISDLLAAISEKFDDLYARQIRRASRARRREELRLRRERRFLPSQRDLSLG
jgi:hypothetical protein